MKKLLDDRRMSTCWYAITWMGAIAVYLKVDTTMAIAMTAGFICGANAYEKVKKHDSETN